MSLPRVSGPPIDDQLFRLLVEQVKDYAIFMLDPNGIVLTWNAGAERIKGYQAHEIIGDHFSRFYPEEAIRSGWPRTELELATRDGRFEDEGWRLRKDGSRFWANVVLTRLTDANGNLRGFAKVTRDLTDRRRIERLEADAQQMSEFVAMLAHELRNPLAPIRSAVSVARHVASDPARIGWALEVIDRQTTHLTALVDDLLDVSRITRGHIRLDRRRLPLGEALDAAIEAVQPAIAQRGHELVVERHGDPNVRADPVRLTQVLTNLLSNATKYTPPNGRIQVVLDSSDDFARVVVRDNGTGIAPDLLPRVFDLFTQDKRSLDRAEGGLGLGLAIVKRLVEMHRGRVTVHSAGSGCGAEFTVELPLFSEDGTHAQTALVIDDNFDAAATLQALVELNGHRCVTAADGISGIEKARELRPDVVLLDIGMPGMNGYEVARALRAQPALEDMLLVAVTGYASDEDRAQALEAGFTVHLTKPVTYEQLVQNVPLLGPRQVPGVAA
jgi:PAS domain S-box-containing protein